MDKNNQNPMVGTVPVNQVGSDVMGAGVTNGVVGGPSSAAPSQAISTFSTIKKRYGRRGGRTTNNGDIILNAPRKNSRKPLIIGLIIFALVAIMFITVVLLNTPKSLSTRSAFVNFANFIINGNEEQDFSSEEYSRSKYYAIEKAIDEHDTAFFDKAGQLFNSFKVESEKDDIKERVDAYSKSWQIIDAYARSRMYEAEYFLDFYFKNGEETTTMNYRFVNNDVKPYDFSNGKKTLSPSTFAKGNTSS